MPGSVASLFSEPQDFEAALREEGWLGLLVTGRGRFRARLIQVALHRLRLSEAEEQLSRIGFIAVPADRVLILFATGSGTNPVCGGIEMRAGEIMTLGPGERVHARSEGPSCWGAVWFPVADILRYGRALTGAEFPVPSAMRRSRPGTPDARHLCSLHAAAIRTAKTRPQSLVDAEAAHGLEQQLIHAAVACLSPGSADEATSTARRHQGIMARFEDRLRDQPDRNIPMAEICEALRVSERLLRLLCVEHLGMGPIGYNRLRRISSVRRALRRQDAEGATVSDIAQRHGFRDAGRFAAAYRAAFGELPSTTLQKSLAGK